MTPPPVHFEYQINMVFIANRDKNGICNCKTRIIETEIRRENNWWIVKYSFDTLSDVTLHVETDNFSEIKFPGIRMCPYEDQE